MKKNVFEIIAMVVFVIALASALLWQRLGTKHGWFMKGENDGEKIVDRDESNDIFGILDGNNPTRDSNAVSVTKENFRAVIDSVMIPESYSWKAKVKTHYAEKPLTEEVRLEHSDTGYRLEISQNGRIRKSVVDDGESITVTEYAPERSAVYPSGTSDVFAEGMLPSVYSFLDLPEDTTEFDYSLYKGKYGNCTDLDFAYTLGETEVRESYPVSVDFGLVVAAKTYQNEELVYELETEELSLK